MTAFNLRAALEPVWRGEAYWARRERGEELTVWRKPGDAIDPDGRLRSMRSDEEALRWANERRDVLAWLPQSCTVYDLGCGDGKLKVARPDLSVIGWDPSEAIRLAQSRGVVASHPYDTDPATVDALWCCHVVEHMDEPLADLATALATVRPGGTIIVETPDFGSPVALEWGNAFRLLHDPTHVSLFTSESLIRMLRALNVEVLEVAWPGYFGTPLEERCGELRRDRSWPAAPRFSPPAPGNVVAVRGRRR